MQGCLFVVSSLSHVWPFVTPWSRTLPGSCVHRILQTRILEWVAIFSSRRSSPPRDGTRVSCIARWILTAEPSGKLVPGFPSMQMWGILQGNQLQVLMVWVPESLYQVLVTTCYSIYIIYVMQTNEVSFSESFRFDFWSLTDFYGNLICTTYPCEFWPVILSLFHPGPFKRILMGMKSGRIIKW